MSTTTKTLYEVRSSANLHSKLRSLVPFGHSSACMELTTKAVSDGRTHTAHLLSGIVLPNI